MTSTQNEKTITARRPSAPVKGDKAANSMLVRVARDYGVSPFKQFMEMVKLRLKPSMLTDQEYYEFRLYRGDMAWEKKAEFLGEIGCSSINMKLAPPGLTLMRSFLKDKVTYTAMLRQLGFDTTETQAVMSLDRDLGNIPVLRSAEAIRDFLVSHARYPLFGKPVSGMQAMGTAAIDAVDAASGTLSFCNGQTADLDGFCAEIMREYHDGYMFQSMVSQHPEIEARTGRAVGTLRLVTVIEEDRPRVLYAIWKIPSATSMSDNFWQKGNMIAGIDMGSGKVLNCRAGKGPDSRAVEDHPENGLPIVGFELPHWRAVMDMAVSCHAIYPINGCLGWDIAIGPDGPVMIECNVNTGHDLYQHAFDHGGNNPEFAAVFERIKARNKRLSEEIAVLVKKRDK